MAEEPSFAESVMQVMDLISPVKEAVLGYRRELVGSGVGSDIADAMAADLHRLLIEQMIMAIRSTGVNA